jgi:hypothetical protein
MKYIKKLSGIFMAFIIFFSFGPEYVSAYEGKGDSDEGTMYEIKTSAPVSALSAAATDADAEDGEDAADGDTPYSIRRETMTDNADNLYADGNADGVYINGETGDDLQSGLTKEAAVKTFERAKEILDADTDLDTIYVTGKITVTEKTTFNLEGRKLVRYPEYKGILIELEKDSGADLTLTDIVADGLSGEGYKDVQSLVKVNVGTTLTIDKGTVLQNNDVSLYSTDYAGYCSGGAVCSLGTVVMNDGVVQNCSAINGGGIYCSRGTFILNGGVIRNNKNYQSMTDRYGNYIITSGGGVMVNGSAVMTMYGGTISENEASDGGGISVGGNWYIDPSIDGGTEETYNFTMYGGIIDNNTAGECGGGIYVQSLFGAEILAGTISNNHCIGRHDGYFGGGGIYVNGGKEGFTSGCLKLSNVIISGNTAQLEGGGIAGSCTSDTQYYAVCGGAVYDNAADSGKSDILVSNSNGTYAIPTDNIKKYISEYMSCGAPCYWQYTGTGSYAGINCLQSNGSISIYMDKTDDDDEIKKVRNQAQVFITGNTSETCGGGIGSSGEVVIGDRPVMQTGTLDITVTKIWGDSADKADERPAKVRVWLLRDGERLSCLEFKNRETDETLKFTNLEAFDENGREYSYTVEEDNEGLSGGYVGIAEKKSSSEWVVTNVPAGSIEVSSTVSGTGASRTKNFVFKVTLSDTEIQGKYGNMTFEKGASVFMLKDGESRYAVLPADVAYTVEEIDSHDYSETINRCKVSSIQGTIVCDEIQTAVFNNYKDKSAKDSDASNTKETPFLPETSERLATLRKKNTYFKCI